jgi:hypothetical protein
VSNTARIKACGGLGPFAWTIIGPATLASTSGIANTVTCVPNTEDPSAVIVTVTDAVGVSVSLVLAGNCACADPDSCVSTDAATSTQCTSDYMKYSYDPADVTWGGDPLELEFWGGDGGCGGGSQVRWALAASGGDTVDITTTNGGGSVLYYGMLNPNQIGASGKTANAHAMKLMNLSNPIISNVVGTPSFGIAVNCPSDVTCDNFTGLVVLFDYPSGSVILGSYTNADLGAGTYPTTIATLTSIPSDVQEIILQNGYKSGGIRVVEVFLTGGSSFTYENPPAQDLVSETAGYGIFWLKSSAAGSFRLTYDDNTSAVLTFVD